MAYAMAKNNAVPSLIISPDMSAGDVELDPDVAKTMKKRVAEDFSGDAAGGVAVLTDSFKIEKVSFSPDEMALDQMRVKPEERITAVLGLNCMVLGLGAGLAHNTYSNYEEARQAAWEDGMLPLQCAFAEAYTEALRLDFGFPEGAYLAFDNSQVRALADDVSADGTRAAALYQAGVVDRATAKRIAGESPDPADVGVYHPKADPDAMTTDGQPAGMDPAAAVNAVGILIRSGFKPDAALSALGLPPIAHTGLDPVTLAKDEPKPVGGPVGRSPFEP